MNNIDHIDIRLSEASRSLLCKINILTSASPETQRDISTLLKKTDNELILIDAARNNIQKMSYRSFLTFIREVKEILTVIELCPSGHSVFRDGIFVKEREVAIKFHAGGELKYMELLKYIKALSDQISRDFTENLAKLTDKSE